MSAIPVFGQDLVELIWGGFSVNNATLNRFFSLHFLLPFLLAALVVAHLMALHLHGSNNPNGISGSGDRIAFHPYFIFKDLVTIFLFLLALSVIVFFYPNLMGHSDNYIPANPMQTPASIVPEWWRFAREGKDAMLNLKIKKNLLYYLLKSFKDANYLYFSRLCLRRGFTAAHSAFGERNK